MEGAAQRPLHQDASCAVLILPKARHGVVFAAPQTDPIGGIDSLKHPYSAARNHLQRAWLLPKEAVERLAHVKSKGLRPAVVELEKEHTVTGWDLISVVDDEDIIWAQVEEARDAIPGEKGAQVIISNPAVLAATSREVVQEDIEHLVADVVKGAIEEHLAELEGPRVSVGCEVRLTHHKDIHHISQLMEAGGQQVKLMVDIDSVDDPPRDLPRHKAVLGGQVGVLDHSGDPTAGAMPAWQAHTLHPLAPLGPAGTQWLASCSICSLLWPPSHGWLLQHLGARFKANATGFGTDKIFCFVFLQYKLDFVQLFAGSAGRQGLGQGGVGVWGCAEELCTPWLRADLRYERGIVPEETEDKVGTK